MGIWLMEGRLKADSTYLLGCNWTTAQDLDPAVPNSNDCRLNSVLCRSRIDYQWDASVEFIEQVLRSSWTDSTEAIGARCRQRFVQRTGNLSENRMRTQSNCHCVETCGHDVRNDLQFRQNHREWAGPEFVGQPEDQFSILLRQTDNSLKPFTIREMHN